MLWGALCLALLSWPFQVFSHATTCNNGSYAAFMAGSIITTPLLLGLTVLLVLAKGVTSRPQLAAAITIVACHVTMLLFDSDIVFDTVVHGTPCGADMADAFVQVSTPDRLLIILAYFVLPLVNMVLSGLVVWRSTRIDQDRDLSI